jgi:hypothetical protein
MMYIMDSSGSDVEATIQKLGGWRRNEVRRPDDLMQDERQFGTHLEVEGAKKVQQILSENKQVDACSSSATSRIIPSEYGSSATSLIRSTADSFLNIIKEGAKQFEKETGRPMTYAEMREAYG